jgi:hypothetical protein
MNKITSTEQIKELLDLPFQLEDRDYDLVDGGAWFSLSGFSIRIYQREDGVFVKIYAKGHEAENCLVTCHVTENDLGEFLDSLGKDGDII